jgi:hypothetical protein
MTPVHLDRNALHPQFRLHAKRRPMSEHKPDTKVPDGQTRFFTTRPMAPNEKGFVGFETVWKPFQKEVEYKTPKRP